MTRVQTSSPPVNNMSTANPSICAQIVWHLIETFFFDVNICSLEVDLKEILYK